MEFSWVEKVVLLVLLSASIAAFWRTFGAALSNIFASAKDPDFRLRPLGPRFRKLFWEVLVQGLVIKQRPLPGLAHAFVFWGFLAFAAITVNHVALAFGGGFIPPRSGYEWFVAAFAFAVAVSIAGLAFRRFVIRPRWLEPISPESGLIAFLIFALMVTYLLEFWIPEGGAAATGQLVGAHAGAAFFLPLIPHTKHLHLVLSPFTVFLERHGFSRIPPLAGDEDFGLDTGKDLTRIYSLQAYSCVECGRCTEHCPANNTGKILDPKEIILGTRSYLKEFGPRGTEPLLGKHLSMEAAFQCTTCGACEFQCPVGIQHLPFIIGLRRGAVNTGKWEDSYGTDLFLNLERHGNALGFAHAEREKFIEKNASALLRRLAGLLPVDGLHGVIRSAGPRDRAGLRARAEASRHHVRRAQAREVYGRPGAAARQRLPVRRAGAGEPRADAAAQREEAGLDLPALRAHHPRGLEGVRRGLRDRASQRTAGALRRATAGQRREPLPGGLSRRLLPGPLSRHLRCSRAR